MARRFLIAALAVAVVGLLAGYWHFAEMLERPRDGALAERPVAGEEVAEGATAGPSPSDQTVSGFETPASETREPADEGTGIAPDPASGTQTAQTTPADGSPSETAPRFDLLRVEPDGSTVIAGTAEAGSRVRLLDGTRDLAETTADAAGAFAFVLEEPLGRGEHTLSLASDDGDRVALSEQSAVVSVPERGREDELLVLLEEPNRPVEIVAAPAAAVLPAEPSSGPAEPEPSPLVAALAPGIPSSTVEAENVTQTASLQETAAEPNSVAPVDTQAPTVAPLAIGAVEIEGDRLFVAGTAEPGADLRLYLDDKFIAAERGGGNREFLASVRKAVPVGPHVVRADQIGADGSVMTRVEVPFERPAGRSMAAVAAPAAMVPPAEPGDDDLASETVAVADGHAAVPAAQTGGVAGTPPSVPETPQDGPAVIVQQAGLEPVEGRVIIRRGDTLWRISRDSYGRGSRYTVIYLANGDQIRDPDLIYPGQIFRVPDGDDNDPS